MTELIKTEQWRTIKDFSKYAISNYGQVKRIKAGQGAKVGHILKSFSTYKGYLLVKFSLSKYKSKTRQAHHLVLEAFVSPRPEGKECNHKDGNKANNYIENLEWVTASENVRHSFDILGHIGVRGEQHGRAKLTENNVHNIRNLYATGHYKQSVLAKQFNIDQTVISDIILRRIWKHIQ